MHGGSGAHRIRRAAPASCSTSSWPRWRPTTPTSTGTCSSARTTSPRRRTRDQQRRSGEDFIVHPLGVARILAELRRRRRDDRRRAPPRRRRGHRRDDRAGARRVRRRDRPARRGRHEADADPLPEPRAGAGRELPQDDRRDGAGPPRHPHQARRPPPQHADDRVPRASRSRSRRRARRSRSTRRSRTASVSTRSSGSSRTSRSRRSTRASTRRSRRW